MNNTTKVLLKKQCERLWKQQQTVATFSKQHTMNCTIKNAAQFLQVSERTVRNYIEDWMLDVIKIQRPGKEKYSIRITTESLNALVLNSTVKKEETVSV